jgi:hypothetical protein
MTSRLLPLASIAALSLAVLTGCSFFPSSGGTGGSTVDASDLADAAEDWLDDDEDVKYSVECEDEEVTLAEDESVNCVATDRDTDTEYDVEITITDVDGSDFEVEVDRDSDARSNDDDDDSDGGSGSDDVFSLVVGDCFNDAEVGIEGDEPVDSVDIVDCDDPHEREVYARMEFEGDDDDYPGETAVTDEGDVFCYDEYEDFVGISYDDSTLFFVTFYPTEDSWSEGDRELLCMISEYDENDEVVKVEGSLEGSER